MRYVFGEYSLDLQARELRRAGQLLKLRPKVFQLLTYLIGQRHRVVPKQELLEQLWPGQFVGDAVLLSCIRAARQAVGDTGNAQHIIRTMHSHGYRFIAPVDEDEPAPVMSADRIAPAAPSAPDGHGDAPVAFPCPACQRPRSPEALFCPGCGARLTQLCPGCGGTVRQPATYCPTCGYLLEEAQPGVPYSALEGEHKLVTILCCALAEASTLAVRLGPEAMHHLMQALFAVAQEVMQRYEGTITHFTGEGFTALFGVPLAQEDHAWRAVVAALDLRDRWRAQAGRVALTRSGALPVCLGLHTGPVVVRALESASGQVYTVVGATVSLATRLLHQAAPGAILISETTQQLLQEDIQVEPCGSLNVGETSGPMPLYAVQSLVRQRAGVRGRGGRPLSRFVGRVQELELLHERLGQVASGQGQVVGIVAEPGMGKSRLLTEFRRSLSDQPVTYREGHCFPYRQATPYGPVRELLQQHWELTAADPAERTTAAVQRGLQAAGLASEEATALLLRFLDVAVDAASDLSLSPQAQRTRTLTLLRHLFLHASQQRLLVLAVENCHWIDATSEEWLTALIGSLVGAPLLLLATYRPGYRLPWLEHATMTQLALARLTPGDSRAVVQSVLQTRSLPERVVQEIVARAEGNPFFLEELTRTVAEQGDGHTALPIPDTVQGVLAARMDRLPATEKRLLQTAAVLGNDVPVALLRAVTGMAEEALYRHLTHLQRAGFLYETRLMPTLAYTFTQALTQEVAYQSLLRHTRQQLHHTIARVLEAQFPEVARTSPEQLAHHYSEAGLKASAVVYWQQAGERALERSAYVEALAHLTRGMDALKTLPDTPARRQRELALLIALGPVLYAVKGEVSPELLHVYQRAQTLSRDAEAPQLFPVLYGLWRVYSSRGEQGSARELAAELLHLAQRLHDPALEVVGAYVIGATLYRLGEFPRALAHLTHGTHLYDPQQHRALAVLYTVDPGVACHCFAAHVLWLLGYPDQAVQQCQAALRLAQQPPHPLSLAMALYFRTVLCHFRREAQPAQALAETAMAHATAQGFPSWLAQTTMLRGWARAMQGDYQEGLAQIHTGVAMFQTAEGDLPLPYPLSLLAEALYTNGQTAASLQVLERVLALMEQGGICWWRAEIYRLQGECLLRQGGPDVAGAERHLRQALDLARQQQAKALELRAATSLSRLWQGQGQCTAARTLLAEVYGWFTEGFDTADLQEARTLLQELEG